MFQRNRGNNNPNSSRQANSTDTPAQDRRDQPLRQARVPMDEPFADSDEEMIPPGSPPSPRRRK